MAYRREPLTNAQPKTVTDLSGLHITDTSDLAEGEARREDLGLFAAEGLRLQ